MENLQIHTEAVEDVPLLMAQLAKMKIPAILDTVIKRHGNREGLSVGQVVGVWLSYILSEGDHRMVVLEDWVKGRQMLLSELVGERVEAKDFTDDRLGDVLETLSKEAHWEAIEEQLGHHLVQVYDLGAEPVRLDSTSVSGHHQIEENGLFQYGYSKDHRPELAQFKVMLGTLDPLGLPLATLIPSGEQSDDGLYIPTIERTRKMLGTGGRLYVGDSKLSARENRAFIDQGEDYYLTTLPRRQNGDDALAAWVKPVLEKRQPLQMVCLEAQTPEDEALWALGYEATRSQSAEIEGTDKPYTWQERVIVVHRPSMARQERRALEKRLEKACRELKKLVPGRAQVTPRWTTPEALQVAVDQVIKEHRVDGLLTVSTERVCETRDVRAYKDRPARTETRIKDVIHVQRNAAAIRTARHYLGWRLYVSNAPADQLSLSQLVLIYRDAPRIELDFRRLKGRSLGLLPVYTHRDDHTLGLARLLTLALRVLTLVEFGVREQLEQEQDTLMGLYPGQPSRTTDRPTTERLLYAFRGIFLTLLTLEGQPVRHLTPLTPLQQRILELLDFPVDIYARLAIPTGDDQAEDYLVSGESL